MLAEIYSSKYVTSFFSKYALAPVNVDPVAVYICTPLINKAPAGTANVFVPDVKFPVDVFLSASNGISLKILYRAF